MADVNPDWFRPTRNQNEYTQGFYQGREYERKRIIAILKDWDLNLRWDWVDIFRLIDEGMEYRQLTMSPALLEDYKRRAAEIEQERIIKLLEPEVTRHYQLQLNASAAYLEQTIALIKGEAE